MAKAEPHMEELARHHVIWQEQEGNYEVQINRPGIVRRLGFSPDTAEWFAWLERIPSFRFHGKLGHFTVRKRGGVYWIAYRHIRGKRRQAVHRCASDHNHRSP